MVNSDIQGDRGYTERTSSGFDFSTDGTFRFIDSRILGETGENFLTQPHDNFVNTFLEQAGIQEKFTREEPPIIWRNPFSRDFETKVGYFSTYFPQNMSDSQAIIVAEVEHNFYLMHIMQLSGQNARTERVKIYTAPFTSMEGQLIPQETHELYRGNRNHSGFIKLLKDWQAQAFKQSKQGMIGAKNRMFDLLKGYDGNMIKNNLFSPPHLDLFEGMIRKRRSYNYSIR